MPKKKPTCAIILRRMVNLKQKGHEDFFRLWGLLRSELYDTPEYKQWMTEVRAASGNRCVTCSRPGRHCHHKVRVYDNPLKAVDTSNGAYLCVRCHKKEHSNGTGKVSASSRTRAKQYNSK